MKTMTNAMLLGLLGTLGACPEAADLAGRSSGELTESNRSTASQRVVFRPGDPKGSRDNVFTSWMGAYSALRDLRGRGQVDLQFDDSFVTPVVIPAGRWEMNGGDVRWEAFNDNPLCNVELADGAQIVIDPPAGVLPGFQKVLTLAGTTLRLISNRQGPIAPFIGINLVLVGNRVRLINTSPLALPMIEVGDPNQFIAIGGGDALGGIGDSAPLPAPLVDIKGGKLIVACSNGYVSDNAFTDTVGGGTVTVRVMSDSCGGGNNSQTYDFPGLTKNGAHLVFSTETRDRYRVFAPVTAGSHNATYNELVLVNATTSVTIVAPHAKPAVGERFVVKDISGPESTGTVSIIAHDGETIDDPYLGFHQAKTWASDGAGTWWSLGSPTPN